MCGKRGAPDPQGQDTLKIVTDASYVIKGFYEHNRDKYMKGSNADIWEKIYKRMDELEIKPTLHKIKSHITVAEAAKGSETNGDIDKWMISNEAADIAAGAIADHQGNHKHELDTLGFVIAQLWKTIRRISTIEL